MLATLLILGVGVAVASADPATDSFRKGKELLKQGELQPALRSFGAAVKADPKNSAYKVQYMQTRQAIVLQSMLENEKDPQKWQRMAAFLHAFYLKNGCLDLALEHDTAVHKKLGTAVSGMRLATTQMELKQNNAAAKTLANLPPEVKKSDWAVKALLTVALSRDGKEDDAKKIAATILLPKELKSGRALLAARVDAIQGEDDAALANLTKAFETTPPSRLPALKEEAKTCPELASLASTDAFAKALKTESKVPESSCSGGSSCATCPNRAKCQGKKSSK
ncbi:MAG: hypothetical protein PVH19_09930 [Planctomycetia bacterium]|jgi:thioredoxin-like negative regulator of GroEL